MYEEQNTGLSFADAQQRCQVNLKDTADRVEHLRREERYPYRVPEHVEIVSEDRGAELLRGECKGRNFEGEC